VKPIHLKKKYVTSIFIGMNLKLKIMVQKIAFFSKSFFGILTLFNYAMAEILSSRQYPLPFSASLVPTLW